jgi:hypothetical protein
MHVITRPFHDIGGRKYIEIDHYKIKIPWRYNRVIGVGIEGTTLPIQSLPKDTRLTSVKFKTKIWEGEEYKVLESISVEKM